MAEFVGDGPYGLKYITLYASMQPDTKPRILVTTYGAYVGLAVIGGGKSCAGGQAHDPSQLGEAKQFLLDLVALRAA